MHIVVDLIDLIHLLCLKLSKLSMSTHEFGASLSTSSEISVNIFKYKVEKDDPLWKQYVEKAALFDERIIDQWNKIVDVILVYVGISSSIPLRYK